VQAVPGNELCLNKKNVMKKNMGSADRIVRIVIAILLIMLYFTGVIPGTAGIVLTALAGVFLLTSAAGFCPLYVLFGINTCKR
jgi:hypothetical protein